MYGIILKLVRKPEVLLAVFCAIVIGVLMTMVLLLKNEKLELGNSIDRLGYEISTLEAHNKKCITERDLVLSDQEQQNKIIIDLRASLVDEQANCARMIDELKRSQTILNSATEIPVETLITKGRVVDEKSSSNLVAFINSDLF